MMKATFYCLFSALLTSADLPATPAPATVKTGNVVLVHGFLDTGRKFKTLKKRLEARGYHCLSPSLTPCDGRTGIDDLAQQLKQQIDTSFPEKEKITIIGFSMGGLISRYYLQELGGATRCERLITLATPHHGTCTAWCYPGKGAWQMRPGSAFLTSLQRTEFRLGNMPITSYRTPMDLIILPTTSPIWDRAENVSRPVWVHPLVVTSPTILAEIENLLGE